MQTGIVQPSGPSIHFCSSFGSVWARYTASGGAAKRLVTTTWVSPSVCSVILLIVFLLFSVFPRWREPRPAGHSFSPAPFAAWPAIGPLLRRRLWRVDEGASYHRRDAQQVLRLRAPSSVERLPVASSQRARPAPLRSLLLWRDGQELRAALDRPRRRRRHRDSKLNTYCYVHSDLTGAPKCTGNRYVLESAESARWCTCTTLEGVECQNSSGAKHRSC